jgi:cell division protein FtsQ
VLAKFSLVKVGTSMPNIKRIPALTKKTQKKRKVNRFFLALGLLFFLGICLVLFLRSPLSKVDTIEVTGNELLNRDQVIQFSNVTIGQSFFTVNTDQIKNTLEALAEVKSAVIERHFPGKIILSIKENNRVAFLMGNNDKIIPVLENGRPLENRPWNDRLIDKPLIRHWTNSSLLPKLCEELIQLEPAIVNSISEIEPDGQGDPMNLKLFMKDGYEVHTSIRHFSQNMSWYPSFVNSLKQEGKPRGIIMLFDGKWFVPYNVKKEEGTAGENS